jgi:GNAT superfamily N-acetyltransferase
MSPPVEITSSTGPTLIPQTASLYATAFRSDPAITYVLGTLSQSQRQSYLEEYFTRIATAAALNSATFLSASNHSSIAIVLPPGKTVDNPFNLIHAGVFRVLYNLGLTGCWRMLGEYEPAIKRVRKAVLGSAHGKKFYHLFFIATRQDARGKGLSSALIGEVQAKARREGLPVWLEATTEYSAGVYAKSGFERCGTVVLGAGKVDGDGLENVGGGGVPVYCMVWWPGKET